MLVSFIVSDVPAVIWSLMSHTNCARQSHRSVCLVDTLLRGAITRRRSCFGDAAPHHPRNRCTLHQIAQELLDLSMIESGRAEFILRQVNLRRHCAGGNQTFLGASSAWRTRPSSEEIPPDLTVLADADQIGSCSQQPSAQRHQVHPARWHNPHLTPPAMQTGQPSPCAIRVRAFPPPSEIASSSVSIAQTVPVAGLVQGWGWRLPSTSSKHTAVKSGPIRHPPPM